MGVGMDAPLDCTSYAHPRAKACFALMFASPPERGGLPLLFDPPTSLVACVHRPWVARAYP